MIVYGPAKSGCVSCKNTLADYRHPSQIVYRPAKSSIISTERATRYGRSTFPVKNSNLIVTENAIAYDCITIVSKIDAAAIRCNVICKNTMTDYRVAIAPVVDGAAAISSPVVNKSAVPDYRTSSFIVNTATAPARVVVFNRERVICPAIPDGKSVEYCAIVRRTGKYHRKAIVIREACYADVPTQDAHKSCPVALIQRSFTAGKTTINGEIIVHLKGCVPVACHISLAAIGQVRSLCDPYF